MSDISKKPKWMIGKMSECGNSRIDCALGVELKTIRMNNNMTLMTMSKEMGFTPAQLSNYEHNIGALNPNSGVDAAIIDNWCKATGNHLSDNPLVLSITPVITDLTKSKAMLARWRDGDFSQEGDDE